ncbi:unnamed protein product, partial [Musa textilis]
MATSSSASATERARFFFAAALLLVMLLAAPKPRRGRALGPSDPAIQLPSGRPDPEPGGGRRLDGGQLGAARGRLFRLRELPAPGGRVPCVSAA